MTDRPAAGPSRLATPFTVAVPPDVADRLGARPLPEGVRVVAWDQSVDLPADVAREVAVVVAASGRPEHLRRAAALPALRVLQVTSAGYEHAVEHVPPGVVLCNGRGVHDASTAELAVGLLLASQRGIDDAARAMPTGTWEPRPHRSLADRRVLVLGYGSIGAAVARRLAPFEVELVRVASTARDEAEGHVHGVDELPALLPEVDVVVVTLPLTSSTTHLLDADLLARLPDDALVVNVGRGGVVDTDALLAELERGRLRAALDVTDPEPLPSDHTLWRAPGCLITPHVGGYTDAARPRVVDLVRRQLTELAAGREPVNVVHRA